jgi:hypothetical protein
MSMNRLLLAVLLLSLPGCVHGMRSEPAVVGESNETVSSPDTVVQRSAPRSKSFIWKNGLQVGSCFMEPGAVATITSDGFFTFEATVSSGDTNDKWENLSVFMKDSRGSDLGAAYRQDQHNRGFKMSAKDHKYTWSIGRDDLPNTVIIDNFDAAVYMHFWVSC